MFLVGRAAVRIACGLAVGAFLGGCGGTTDKITLTSSPRLNTCEGGGDAHPVVVRIFYLKARDRFERADFTALWQDDVATLEGDRIKVEERTLNPKQQITVALKRDEASKGAAAIGVVANFCKPGEGCWRRWVDIDDDSAEIRVHLDEGCLSID